MASGLPRNASFGSVSSMSTGGGQADSSNMPYADLSGSQDSLSFAGKGPEVKPKGFWNWLSSPSGIFTAVGLALAGILTHGCRNSTAWLRSFFKKAPQQPAKTAEQLKEQFAKTDPKEKIAALTAAQKAHTDQHFEMLKSVKGDLVNQKPEVRLTALEQSVERAKNDAAHTQFTNELAQKMLEHHGSDAEVLAALKQLPKDESSKTALIEAAKKANDATFSELIKTAASHDEKTCETILNNQFTKQANQTDEAHAALLASRFQHVSGLPENLKFLFVEQGMASQNTAIKRAALESLPKVGLSQQSNAKLLEQGFDSKADADLQKLATQQISQVDLNPEQAFTLVGKAFNHNNLKTESLNQKAILQEKGNLNSDACKTMRKDLTTKALGDQDKAVVLKALESKHLKDDLALFPEDPKDLLKTSNQAFGKLAGHADSEVVSKAREALQSFSPETKEAFNQSILKRSDVEHRYAALTELNAGENPGSEIKEELNRHSNLTVELGKLGNDRVKLKEAMVNAGLENPAYKPDDQAILWQLYHNKENNPEIRQSAFELFDRNNVGFADDKLKAAAQTERLNLFQKALKDDDAGVQQAAFKNGLDEKASPERKIAAWQGLDDSKIAEADLKVLKDTRDKQIDEAVKNPNSPLHDAALQNSDCLTILDLDDFKNLSEVKKALLPQSVREKLQSESANPEPIVPTQPILG